jgi:ATP-dependent DNA helicase DinG
MAAMGYGRRLREALPPMGLVREEGEALDWLASIAGAAPC